MANPRSFVLELAENCLCQPCKKKLEKVKKIDGVDSLSIDEETRQMTISGNVDPQKVIRYLEKHHKQAKLVPEEIPPKRNNHYVPIIVLPRPVIVQEFNDQNLVAQVRELAENVEGLEQVEITYRKNVKVTINGKNKDEGDCYGGHGTGTSFGGRRPHGKDIIPRYW
ncbi:hypothetical protein RHMOL_Rhmol13G0029800 [Rhododendron molle]|uniref:Uncharacterized protein n=1 Tax=Rhododendron molle TaxID=49168 RepID=A0ACC0L3P8_RHOML|nr:hypothetical protein RHMOL_Rhmol13G0029800 [Rhododendron molle]